ncbi:hypothetical protein T459_11465 [Capsicum annuum]|uniref:Uncharacterized protein n=1 Tax=Capsicum annuum TaxID=4072 RepID=A0A2G2ZM10_CAPAN|nr:hypothetical protein T459_11465 [Capsicum annuum]
MHKNSVVCENEYIQFDTPFYPSTNQVKQRTKEAEATIGKGPEGGNVRMGMIRKNSMVLEKEYMQVDTTFSPSTNQNSVGSNQGMQSMDNNPMIHGKENMQTNISLPPSPEKIMKPSQNFEIDIVFRLYDKFESNNMNDHCDHIFGWMNELWKKLRRRTGSVQARSKRNTANRANLTMLHHIGSKPIREIMYQQAQIEEIVKAEPSLPTIEIVEKCWGPQNCSHVGCFGSGVKVKDIKGDTSSKTELLFALRSTRDDNKSLIEEIKSLNNRLSTLEDEM